MKKKLLTSILAASLVLGSVAPASNLVFSDENTGTITVKSTQAGATYSAYKLFDATMDGTGAVSYTVPKGKEAAYKNEAFLELFDLTDNGDLIYVTKKPETTDKRIAEWAKEFVKVAQIQPLVTAKETGGDGQETLNVTHGYYFVGTTVASGATVMVTSASPNATIQEKNNEPTWGDTGGKTVDSVTKTYSVGDTITYTLDYKNATYYSSGEKVYQYVVKDTLGDGIQFNQDSIKVFVDDTELTADSTNNNQKNTYQVVKTANGFTVTIRWAATEAPTAASKLGEPDDFYYNPISRIKVTYTGVLKSAAHEGSTNNNLNKNTATINPNTKQADPGKTVHVYDGQITIKKIDGAEKTKTLQGAKFIIKKKNGNFLKFDTAADKWSEVTEQNQATVYSTGPDGTVVISGLAAGEYQVIEIEAPKGYNLTKTPTDVTLTFDKDTSDGDQLLATPIVENNKGAELPSTGGIGTTIIYTLGASLMIGSGVVLVARRRLRD